MGRTRGAKNLKSSKNLILEKAFILFSSMPYERVTFVELEKAADLSRGAIMNYFKNKEAIFSEVIQNYLDQKISVSKLMIKSLSLKDFIDKYIENCIEEEKRLNNIGIKNVSQALFNVENNAFYYISEMKDISNVWYHVEKEIWQKVITKAIKNKEIREDINVEIVARLFFQTYLGLSFAGIVEEYSPDYTRLKEECDYIYNTLQHPTT